MTQRFFTKKTRTDLFSRRAFAHCLASSGLAALSSPVILLHALQPPSSADVLDKSGLIWLSAKRMAGLIRSKSVSSEELVLAHVCRIEAVNPKLNAVCQLDIAGALKSARAADAARARGESSGPLHGVPFTVKDSFDTAGIISAAGTMGRSQFVPEADATVVARLRKAGAIILGKTNTPELTLDYETDNLVYGRTNNPWNLKCTPGGSSGGAAAIIAAGGSPFDIGSDTAGSLRVPAHFCGIASLKPTYGRVSRAGHIIPPGGVIGSQTHVGPMARHIEDLALLLPIISGPDLHDPAVVPARHEDSAAVRLRDLRVAFFFSNGRSDVSPEIRSAIRNAANLMAGQGSPCEEKCPPGFDVIREILSINIADGGDYYRNLLRACGTNRPHPNTAAYLEHIRSGVISGRKYADLLLDWSNLKEAGLKFTEDFDIIIGPVASTLAPKHGESPRADFSYSYLFNFLGWPAAVVRAGTGSDGLPVGIQIVGRPWKEHHVLAVAARVEQSLGPWKTAFPELPSL